MINFGHANADDRDELICIWQDIFDDNLKFIYNFFDDFFTPEHCFIAHDGDRIVSMLFMLPYKLKSGGETLISNYLYAVATLPKYRGRGIFSNLHLVATTELRKNGTDCIIIVPASKSLYKFYGTLGYEQRLYRTVKKTCTQTMSGYGQYLRDTDKNPYTIVMDKKSFELTLDEKNYVPGGFIKGRTLYGNNISQDKKIEPSGMLLDLSGRCAEKYGLAFLLD